MSGDCNVSNVTFHEDVLSYQASMGTAAAWSQRITHGPLCAQHVSPGLLLDCYLTLRYISTQGRTWGLRPLTRRSWGYLYFFLLPECLCLLLLRQQLQGLPRCASGAVAAWNGDGERGCCSKLGQT